MTSIVLIFGCVGLVTASNTSNHQVTVHVDAINEAAVTGGDITLTINAATAGSQPNNATDATCHLNWTTNEAGKKITVETDQAAPVYTLKVTATAISGGTAAAQVTVSNVAQDFVTAVATTIGTCTLSYVASATAAQGTGEDVHVVTYTLTN
ncbi:MAG TPA: hypothetical protein VGL38_12960 [bacterium]